MKMISITSRMSIIGVILIDTYSREAEAEWMVMPE